MHKPPSHDGSPDGGVFFAARAETDVWTHSEARASNQDGSTYMENQQRPCYARSLRIANKAINDYYTHKLAPAGVAVVQFSILQSVSGLGTCGVCELADAVELDYSTVARSIKPLIERGLLTDETERRGRRRRLTLTDDGRRAVRIGQPLWEQAQQDVRALLGSDEIEHLQQTLSKLEYMA